MHRFAPGGHFDVKFGIHGFSITGRPGTWLIHDIYFACWEQAPWHSPSQVVGGGGDSPSTIDPPADGMQDTVSEFLSLGARQLSGDEIRAELVGQTLDEGGWTWDINEDGTAPARADDLSWIVPSTWYISGNQYCRDNDGETSTRCSNVYELDGVYRFSETDDPEALNGWSVTIALKTSDGLAASFGTPVYAVSGIKGLLESLLPDGNRTFPVVSSAIERSYEDDTVSPYSDGQITSISSDGNGGFRLTLLLDDGEVIPVDFPAGSFTDEGGWERFSVELADGEFNLADREDSFEQADKTRGSPDHAYFDILELNGPGRDSNIRLMFSFGARTPAGGMPEGTAAYYGGLSVDAWNAEDRSQDKRHEYDGDLMLVADFANSSISGVVDELEHEISDRESELSDDNRLDITNGRIVDGRFVADWTGQGPEGGPSMTVRGLEGQLLGEFYGPEAEEVAGVVNGHRAATSSDPAQVAYGRFSGSGRVIDVSGPAFRAHGAQVTRHLDWRDLKQRITSDPAVSGSARVTSIEQVSGGGYQVTYMIDGRVQVIEFDAPDPDPDNRSAPDETANGRDFGLGLFRDPFIQDHVDIVWTRVHCDGSDCESSMSVWSAIGDETAPERLQALGTANYTGDMWAELYPNSPDGKRWRNFFGDMALKADFAEGAISGIVNGLEMQPSERESGSDDPHRPRVALPDSIEISDGQITDGRFTASWAGQDADAAADPDMSVRGFSGDMAGAFYGPDGEEVAGVVGGDGNGWQVMGGFAGVRDTSGTEN